MKQNQQSLKGAVYDMYQDIHLLDSELQSIRNRAEGATQHLAKDSIPTVIDRRFKPYVGQFFLVVACFAIIMIGFNSIWQSSQQVHRMNKVVTDAIDNHLLHKELLYQTASMVELADRFSYLGFMLTETRYSALPLIGDLIGGRPCLIHNKPAAQLRYQLDNHRWSTVFQLQYDRALYGDIPDLQKQQPPLVKVQRGVKVSLWHENGLFFTVVEPVVEPVF